MSKSKTDTIKQKHYHDLVIDNREDDIIQIWQFGKEENNVIQIEREKINELIKQLAAEALK